MTNAQWFILVGALLLVMGLTFTFIKRSPVTSAIIYLAVGLLVGPTVLNLFHFNPLKQSALLETLTEVAVLVSLFSVGIKMPVPFRFSRWRTPILLATLAMTLTVAMVAAFAYYVLGLPLGVGVLLGAILAPTDPVLATDVQIRHPGDRDQLRFTLACEAGMNDGSAFPFVVLGMALLGLQGQGDFGLEWVLADVLWATSAGIAIGVSAGVCLARLGWKLRCTPLKHKLMDDFIGLGMIGVVYGLSVVFHAWGFLAVFFAAVALRQTEQKLTKNAQNSIAGRTSPNLAGSIDDLRAIADVAPLVSDGSLVFKEHLERLSEVVLIFDRGYAVSQFMELESSGVGRVLVRGGTSRQRAHQFDRDAHPMAVTRFGKLVRRARDRVAVLPYVRHSARSFRAGRVGVDPIDSHRRHTLNSYSRNQRKTVDGIFLAAR